MSLGLPGDLLSSGFDVGRKRLAPASGELLVEVGHVTAILASH